MLRITFALSAASVFFMDQRRNKKRGHPAAVEKGEAGAAAPRDSRRRGETYRVPATWSGPPTNRLRRRRSVWGWSGQGMRDLEFDRRAHGQREGFGRERLVEEVLALIQRMPTEHGLVRVAGHV